MKLSEREFFEEKIRIVLTEVVGSELKKCHFEMMVVSNAGAFAARLPHICKY